MKQHLSALKAILFMVALAAFGLYCQHSAMRYQLANGQKCPCDMVKNRECPR